MLRLQVRSGTRVARSRATEKEIVRAARACRRGIWPPMSNAFFEGPILSFPDVEPARHWELDGSGQPTRCVLDARRPADFLTPGLTIKDRLRVLQPHDPD